MPKSSIKYWQTKAAVYQKYHIPRSSQFHPMGAGMVEHMQIIKGIRAYQQKQRQKLLDHLNRCRKSLQ
jgi:hypothetical protein